MAEPFFRLLEIVVPQVVAANKTTISYRGLEHIPEQGGALIVVNHTSYVDWLPASLAALQRKRRLRFMIKAEMQDVPAVNYVIKHVKLIPVDREHGADAYAEAVYRLRTGELVGLHPEATISRSLELRPFKTGAARMALEAAVPIIPMIVWGRSASGRRTTRNSCSSTRFRSSWRRAARWCPATTAPSRS